MAGKFSGFSQLKRSMIKREPPVGITPAPVAIEHDDSDEVLEYFLKGAPAKGCRRAKSLPEEKRNPKPEVEDGFEAKEPEEAPAAKERSLELEEELQSAKSALAAAKEEIEALKAERLRLRNEIASAAEKPEAEQEVPEEPKAAPPEPEKPAAVLSAPAAGVKELFEGELRETVVSALRESYDNAERAGRERRAALLKKVLEENAPSGELDRRRGELRQILKDAGSFTDSQTISALEKLGFRLISGKKHWKLEYGNVRIPLSKTPSDYRSNRNSANDIANKCF